MNSQTTDQPVPATNPGASPKTVKTSEDVGLTARAADQVRKLMQENKLPETYGLRLGVKGGGCSGLSYVLGFDAAARPTDHVFEKEGVRIFVDPKSLFYISGTVLDFSDGLNGRGFTFNNPKATRTCGCGSSFNA
jgi:iron-sulfur cluster assembly protein